MQYSKSVTVVILTRRNFAKKEKTMPNRNRRNLIDVANKASEEFDHWLKINVSDQHHRDWYRSDKFSSEQWLDKIEKQFLGHNPVEH
jgi:hypothetical protein